MPPKNPVRIAETAWRRVAEDEHELARPDDLVDETGRPGQDEDPEDGPARVHPRQVGIDDIARTLQGRRFAPRTLGDALGAGHPDRHGGREDGEAGERQIGLARVTPRDEAAVRRAAARSRRRPTASTKPPPPERCTGPGSGCCRPRRRRPGSTRRTMPTGLVQGEAHADDRRPRLLRQPPRRRQRGGAGEVHHAEPGAELDHAPRPRTPRASAPSPRTIASAMNSRRSRTGARPRPGGTR